MKHLLLSGILLLLFAGDGYARDSMPFGDIPAGISGSEAIERIKFAAQNRRWSIVEESNDSVTLLLEHRDYRARLVIYARGEALVYDDSSQRKAKRNEQDLAEDGWVADSAPTRWVANLRNDTRKLLYELKSLKLTASGIDEECSARISAEEAESRLVSLKSFFDRGLISAAEYQVKKQEILSRF